MLSHKRNSKNGHANPKVVNLPIHRVRSELVSMIRENDTLIVMGETGSGKGHV